MPLLDDIMDHDLFGPKIRKGIEQGMAQGVEIGRRQIVVRMIEKRFGPLPEALNKHIEDMRPPEIDALSLRLLEARSLDELLA